MPFKILNCGELFVIQYTVCVNTVIVIIYYRCVHVHDLNHSKYISCTDKVAPVTQATLSWHRTIN